MSDQNFKCGHCHANWSKGEFSANCKQCGGGAMERPCLVCGGRCGAIFKRAAIDSNDYKEAHWIGGCQLPADEQQRCLQELLEKSKHKT